MENEYLTLRDAAEAVGLTYDALRRAATRNRLHTVQMYGRRLTTLAEAKRYAENTRPGRPKKEQAAE